MKTLLVLVLLACSLSASGAELQFSVIRGDAGTPPGLYEGLDEVSTRWGEDGTLTIETWSTESATDRVVDSSAILHNIANGDIHISYGVFTRPIGPNEAVAGCSDFAMLRFVVSGLDRTDYELVLERRTVVNRASVSAN